MSAAGAGLELVPGRDRITPNAQARGRLPSLGAGGGRELARLYLAAGIVASLVIIAIAALGFGLGLALRVGELVGGS